MLTKRLCPKHAENTPSFVVYEDGWGHCFGCGYHAYVGEGLAPKGAKFVENLEDSLERIRSLQLKPFRGLLLPSDELSSFIVWPSEDYYKRRFHNPKPGQPKYVGAAGHEKPLFVLGGSPNRLFIVEGELNALSIKFAFLDATVVSPGGVNDFYNAKSEYYLPGFLAFSSVTIITDDDGPGVKAAIKLKAKLLARDKSRKIGVVLMSKDANEWLQEGGVDGLRKALERHMEV